MQILTYTGTNKYYYLYLLKTKKRFKTENRVSASQSISQTAYVIVTGSILSFFHLSFISPLLCFCLLALAVTHVALSAWLRLCNSLWHLFFHMVYRCTHTYIYTYILYIYTICLHIYIFACIIQSNLCGGVDVGVLPWLSSARAFCLLSPHVPLASLQPVGWRLVAACSFIWQKLFTT